MIIPLRLEGRSRSLLHRFSARERCARGIDRAPCFIYLRVIAQCG